MRHLELIVIKWAHIRAHIQHTLEFHQSDLDEEILLNLPSEVREAISYLADRQAPYSSHYLLSNSRDY